MEKQDKPSSPTKVNDSQNQDQPLRKEWIKPEILANPTKINSGSIAGSEVSVFRS